MFYLWWWLQWCRWSLGSSFCELCPEQTTKIQRTVLPVWHDKKRGSQGKIHCKSIAINRSPDRSVSGQHPFFSTFWHAKKKTPGPIFSSKRWPHLMAAPFLVQMYWDQGEKRLLSGDWSVRTSINCYTKWAVWTNSSGTLAVWRKTIFGVLLELSRVFEFDRFET